MADSISLKELPACAFERRAALLLHGMESRADQAVRYIKDEYPDAKLLQTCVDFLSYDLPDTARCDWDSLRRIGFFPWVEAERELGEALNYSLLASYKAVFDSCRRALELTLVGVYFIQQHIPESEAREWLSSERNTPFFNKVWPQLLQRPRFKLLDDRAGWRKLVERFYWSLCDIIHVRGPKASFDVLQPSNFRYGSIALPCFSADSLKVALDAFVTTIRHIAAIVAAENPVLLVGFDLSMKFGLNGPMSGFLEEGQSERLRSIIPDVLVPTFLEIAENDQEIIDVRAWFDSMPDVTDEDIKRQAESLKELMRSMSGTAASDTAQEEQEESHGL